MLSGFIAYSIADRPGIAPGLVGGMLAQSLGAGFLGGIVSGFLAGYLTKFLADKIKLPVNLEGLKPVLILPFLSTISVGLLMIYVIAPPVEALNNAMNAWLNGMRGANAVLLGMILGGMMAFDMGGPINKAAYTFSVGLLASKIYGPMAAVMAGGMTPGARPRAGRVPVQEPLRSRGARSRRPGAGARRGVHHRRRDSLRGQGSAARHPRAGARLGGRRRDLDGCRRATPRPAWRHLRRAHPRRGHESRAVISPRSSAGTVVTDRRALRPQEAHRRLT